MRTRASLSQPKKKRRRNDKLGRVSMHLEHLDVQRFWNGFWWHIYVACLTTYNCWSEDYIFLT